MKTRVSTRDEILEALKDRPKGLTSKQLAPLCPAAEYDEMIVGRTVAMLRTEGELHPGTELRAGGTIWILGKEPVEVHEDHISLAGAETRPSSPVSEAALAIARMRQDSPRINPHSAPSKKTPPLTIRAKIEAALREHGPMRSTDIAKHVDEKEIGNHCSSLASRKVLARLGGNRRGTIYGLPGQTLKDQKVEKEQPAKGRAPAPLSRRANGGGGAVTPAAGPAARAPKPLNGSDNLYQAALLDLQERRGVAARVVEEASDQLAKIDRAIEAMRALT